MSVTLNFKTLYERIAIEVIEQDSKTASGIIIPDTAKEKPIRGKVVAVGKGYRNEDGTISSLEVKLNDIVIFGKWAGTEMKIDGKDYLVMKESDILAIIEK